MTLPPVATVPGERSRARRGSNTEAGAPIGSSRTTGYLYVGLYVVLLALFGIAPTVQSTCRSQGGGQVRVGNELHPSVRDFRFLPAFEHMAEYLAIWLIAEATLILVLALMLHSLAQRTSAVFRFLFLYARGIGGSRERARVTLHVGSNSSPWHFLLLALGFPSD